MRYSNWVCCGTGEPSNGGTEIVRVELPGKVSCVNWCSGGGHDVETSGEHVGREERTAEKISQHDVDKKSQDPYRSDD